MQGIENREYKVFWENAALPRPYRLFFKNIRNDKTKSGNRSSRIFYNF